MDISFKDDITIILLGVSVMPFLDGRLSETLINSSVRFFFVAVLSCRHSVISFIYSKLRPYLINFDALRVLAMS